MAEARKPLDSTRLAAARLVAAQLQPFLASALWATTTVPAPGLGTFAVDGKWRLYVDPEALAGWSVAEVAGVLLHETGHLVRDHAGRASTGGVTERTHLVWNLAADAEINDDLIADGVTLPSPTVTPKLLKEPDGRAAEYYYHRLLQRGAPPIETTDCGSGAHGIDPTDETLADRFGRQLVALPPGLNEVETMLIRRQVADAVLARGRTPGTEPGGWQRWAEALLHPVVDWRQVLRSRLRAAIGMTSGQVDYTYSRPSRRRVDGIVLPALRRPLPSVDVIVDTSGSMDEARLGAAWTEVLGCLRSLGVRRDLLRVWAGDTDAVRVHSIARSVALPGGGGTDMTTALETVRRARPRANLAVVLTDGESPWPARPIGVPLVIVLVGGRPRWGDLPSWATVIDVPVPPAATP